MLTALAIISNTKTFPIHWSKTRECHLFVACVSPATCCCSQYFNQQVLSWHHTPNADPMELRPVVELNVEFICTIVVDEWVAR